MLEVLINAVASAFSLIFIALIIDLASDFIIRPGKGVVFSDLFGGLLSKRKGFLVFLVLILAVALFDPANIVSNVSNFVKNPDYGGPALKLAALLGFFWVYFNKKAVWNPLSLGG